MNSPGNLPHDLCADAGPYPRSHQADACDMCGEPCPATPDITEATGFSVCASCCEQTLEGACSEQARI